MKLTALLFFLIPAFSAFASEKYVPDPENQMKAKDVVSVSVPWIKDKGGKFDVNLSIHNEDPEKGIIIFLSDMGCLRGKVRGELKHTFFNTGERTIDFKPNETKSFTLVCRVAGEPRGDFRLSIAKVYGNPSMDGKTVSKVIAKDLSWTQSDKRE
jgi:hypothetical protein